jgi:hypothetical protein
VEGAREHRTGYRQLKRLERKKKKKKKKKKRSGCYYFQIIVVDSLKCQALK